MPACGRCRRAAVRGRRGSRPRSVTRAAGLVGVARDGDRVANGSVVGIGLMASWREYPDGIGGCGGEADDLAERRDKVVTGVFDLSRAQVERVSTAVPAVGDVAGGASPEKPEGVALRSPGVPPSVSVTARRSMRISRAATAAITPPAALMSSPRWQLSTTRWPHDRRFSRGSARIRLLQRSFASAGLQPDSGGVTRAVQDHSGALLIGTVPCPARRRATSRHGRRLAWHQAHSDADQGALDAWLPPSEVGPVGRCGRGSQRNRPERLLDSNRPVARCGDGAWAAPAVGSHGISPNPADSRARRQPRGSPIPRRSGHADAAPARSTASSGQDPRDTLEDLVHPGSCRDAEPTSRGGPSAGAGQFGRRSLPVRAVTAVIPDRAGLFGDRSNMSAFPETPGYECREPCHHL